MTAKHQKQNQKQNQRRNHNRKINIISRQVLPHPYLIFSSFYDFCKAVNALTARLLGLIKYIPPIGLRLSNLILLVSPISQRWES